MEAIHQARKLFVKCHQYEASLTEIDKQQLERDIQRFITIAIKEATSRDLFENVQVLLVLKSALRQCESSDLIPLARAFKSLEKYFLHLVEQPWKPEFREIKLYGGFFRTRIKSVIPDCECIFQCAGYMIIPESFTMILEGPIRKNSLLSLAFDCRVSQVECETIAAHHNKLKGLSVSLTDAISNILRDEYSRDKPAVSYGLSRGNGYMTSVTFGSNPAVPPALPKREPIINGSEMRQNDLENNMYDDCMTEKRFSAGIAYLPKTSVMSSEMYSAALQKPPLTPSSVTPEPIVYMDVLAEEILPELPQGTCEDHMRESLKLVDQQATYKQPVMEDWKWVMDSKNRKSIPNSDHVNYTAPNPYPTNGFVFGAIPAQNSVKPSPSSLDEGIDLDMSHCKSFLNSSKFSSTGGQQVTSSKLAGNYPQPSFDQGYRTVNSESIYVPTQSLGISQNSQQTIYHPPSIVTDGAAPVIQSKTVVSRQSAVPPPIPSRALKPKPKAEDYQSSRLHMSAPHYMTSQPTVNMVNFQNEVTLSRPHMSAPGYSSSVPPVSGAESVLRRERLAVAKTSSLKTDVPDSPLSQQIAMSRMAKSMDMTLMPWECQFCTTLNKASNTICFTCSHSRLGPDVSHPVCGETKKPCSSCTYENSPNSTYCDMCGSKLNDKYTFV